MRARVLAAASLFALAACDRGEVAECACPGDPSRTSAAANALAIFHGAVIDLKDTAIVNTRTRTLEPAVAAAIRADAGWKGFADTVAVVLTPARSSPRAGCAVPFRVGERYLVYATGTSAHLRTSRCFGTRPLADAGDDTAALGPARWRRSGAGSGRP